jgi:hypothetical protein
MYIVIAVIAIALGILRVAGHKSQRFQAIAHLFVGGLFTAAYFRWDAVLLAVAVALSLVELATFLVQRARRVRS